MRKSLPKSYQYIESLTGPESALMRRARDYSEKLGLGGISLSRTEALMICEQLRSVNVKKMVEVGTLTGLSALYWLDLMRSQSADFKLWTIEKSEKHAEAAAEVLKADIESGHCSLIIGDARLELEKLESAGAFDAVFIDGNKAAYGDYFQWALRSVRSGGVIIVDNVFLSGAVWGDQTTQKFNDKQIQAVQSVNEEAFQNSHLTATIIPTEEGLLICKKK